MSKDLIFSGIQPTGDLHLGNYLGAIRNWVKLQDQFRCIYCIVDLHAITVHQNPKDLHQSTLEVAAGLLACGINPEEHILFQQSANPDHAYLGWLFTCVARMGWLTRMTQFKEKAGKDKENASTGLFTYPNLMAADILAYKATHVPVGEDQKQHLELARDIAHKFNNDYDAEGFFPMIEPIIQGPSARVMSLKDGSKKMSKSDPSEQSRITFADDSDSIALKIRKARTDPEPLPDDIAELNERPEAKNLVGILASLRDQTSAQIIEAHGGVNFSQFKKNLADELIATLSPIHAEMKKYMNDPAEITNILNDGAARARLISAPIIHEVCGIMGFVQK